MTRRKVVARKKADVIDLSGKLEERQLKKLTQEYIAVNERRKELKTALTKALMKRKDKTIKTDLGTVELNPRRTRSIDAGRLYNALSRSQRQHFKEVVSVNVKQATDMFGNAFLRKITEVGKSFQLRVTKPKKK